MELSWRILLDDLKSALEQVERGENPMFPPKTTSFQRWSERLQEYAQSMALALRSVTGPPSPILRHLPLDAAENDERGTHTMMMYGSP